MLELRARQRRNLIATLMLSEGVPLLLGGDEFGRSQGGNNNAYCQDNELTWFDWQAVAQHTDLVAFTASPLPPARTAPRCSVAASSCTGTPAHESGRDDLDWYRPDGMPMTPEDWGASYARAVTMALSGDTGDDAHPDDPFLLMFNAWWEPIDFSVPERCGTSGWQTRDRHRPIRPWPVDLIDASAAVPVTERSLVMLHSARS